MATSPTACSWVELAVRSAGLCCSTPNINSHSDSFFIHSFNHQLYSGCLRSAERGLGAMEMVASKADDGLACTMAGHKYHKEKLIW